ncbi:hypothetical protein [Ruminococcus sp.]|uniref:hypothetical protein n=1 Tax=Ruminococcus sp. TaxID=41978 RepID=UPI0025D7C616|nr:hypothetical protein [Ruminococcus sp.]MBQ8967789.1 hypothetical protein [Ruminococcus sp.]
MKNLIKAQIYQITHTRVYLWVFIMAVIIASIFGFSEYLNGADSLNEGELLTASDYFTRYDMLPVLAMEFMSFFSCFIAAEDFGDKTANYELMSGRLRSQSFLARVITIILANTLLGLFMMTLPLLIYTAITGWGDSVTVATAAQRILLMVFPFFRISCFFTLAAFIIRRPGIAFIACYGAMNLPLLLPVNNESTGVMLTLSTSRKLLHFDYWATFGLERDAQAIYDQGLDSAFVIRCIIVSLAVGAAYIGLAYSYFHKDDIE